MKSKLSNTSGITLIALIVTIVVLLLLAGVTIATLTGDNGILSQAQKAQESSEAAKFRDAVQLAYMKAYSDNAQNGIYTVSMSDVLGQLVIDYPEYGQAGKIVDGTQGSVQSIVAKMDSVVLDTETNPLILGTEETKTIIIEPTTSQGVGGTKYVELGGKYYQIILDGNGVTLGEAQESMPVASNNLDITKGTGLTNVTVTETSDLNVEVEAGTTLDSGNITFTYGGQKTEIAVQVKTKYTVTAGVYSGDSEKGSVSISPSSSDNKYAEGSIVRLTATANSGYSFGGWYNGSTKLSGDNPYDYEVGTSNITITAKFVKYGKTVNLGKVTANGIEMESGWQYFYEDDATNGNIYLIYEDYLENAQIPTPTNISKSGYNVYASGNRDNLVNYLKGETEAYSSTWNTINEAVKVAVKEKLIENGVTEANANTAVANITTKGAPTPEQWMSSYNENYGTNLGAESFPSGKRYYSMTSATSVGTSTTTTIYAGYLYTRDNTKTAKNIEWETYLPNGYMNQQAGYPGSGNSNMYYPHAHSSNGWSDSCGYWLARSFA